MGSSDYKAWRERWTAPWRTPTRSDDSRPQIAPTPETFAQIVARQATEEQERLEAQEAATAVGRRRAADDAARRDQASQTFELHLQEALPRLRESTLSRVHFRCTYQQPNPTRYVRYGWRIALLLLVLWLLVSAYRLDPGAGAVVTGLVLGSVFGTRALALTWSAWLGLNSPLVAGSRPWRTGWILTSTQIVDRWEGGVSDTYRVTPGYGDEMIIQRDMYPGGSSVRYANVALVEDGRVVSFSDPTPTPDIVHLPTTDAGAEPSLSIVGINEGNQPVLSEALATLVRHAAAPRGHSA